MDIYENGEWEIKRHEFSDDKILIAYTDGLTDKSKKLIENLTCNLDKCTKICDFSNNITTLIKRIIDTAVELEPLKAFSDDLSILVFQTNITSYLDSLITLRDKKLVLFSKDEQYFNAISKILIDKFTIYLFKIIITGDKSSFFNII